MSPCLTYNKINTYAWFKENVQDIALREDYSPGDRLAAFDALTRDGNMPLGVIYENNRATFEEQSSLPAAPIADLDIRTPHADYAAIQNAYR